MARKNIHALGYAVYLLMGTANAIGQIDEDMAPDEF